MNGRIEEAQRRLDALAARSDAQRARLAVLARNIVAPGGAVGVGIAVWRTLGRAGTWIVAGAAALVILRPSRIVGLALRWWPAVSLARRVYKGLQSRDAPGPES